MAPAAIGDDAGTATGVMLAHGGGRRSARFDACSITTYTTHSGPLGLPLTRQLLGFRDLRGGHELCNVISVSRRILVALCGRQVEPHVSTDVILRHPMAIGVHAAEKVLRVGVSRLLTGTTSG